MAYTRAKLKSNNDKSPCFRPFKRGNASDNVYLYEFVHV